MKEDVMQKLYAVLGALDTVLVSGKQNLANLSGSMAVIEEVIGVLSGADIIATSEEKQEK